MRSTGASECEWHVDEGHEPGTSIVTSHKRVAISALGHCIWEAMLVRLNEIAR